MEIGHSLRGVLSLRGSSLDPEGLVMTPRSSHAVSWVSRAPQHVTMSRCVELLSAGDAICHRRRSVIPIQIVRNQRPVVNVVVRSSYHAGDGCEAQRTPPPARESFSPAAHESCLPSSNRCCCDTNDSEPESPVIEVDLTPSPIITDAANPLAAAAEISRQGQKVCRFPHPLPT